MLQIGNVKMTIFKPSSAQLAQKQTRELRNTPNHGVVIRTG
jgi:hypothetical protein